MPQKFKLFYAPPSPFVRKVLVCAHEKGIEKQIELINVLPQPQQRDEQVALANPTGKIPTLVLPDNRALYDSRVICRYIDTLGDAPKLYPVDDHEKFDFLTLEALADAIMDAAVLARYESALRPDQFFWQELFDGQMAKIDAGLNELETRWLGKITSGVDICSIASACALGYLDFRYPDKDWRTGHPELANWYKEFAKRASMIATAP